MEIVFHPWVTKFVHLEFLRLETFPLGRRLEGKGDFSAYQPMIRVTVCTGHHSRVMLPGQKRSPGGASIWSVGVSMLP